MKRLIGLAALTLVACKEDTEGFYSAEAETGGYFIVRADPETGTCVYLALTEGKPAPGIEFDSDVRIVGDDVELNFAALGPSAEACTPRLDFGDLDGFDFDQLVKSVSGKVTFRDKRDYKGHKRACRVHLDLVVELPDGSEVVFDKRKLPTLWFACPEPHNDDVADWTELEAAASPQGDEFVVAHFDPERGLCAWSSFGVSGAETSLEGIDIPSPWYLQSHGIAPATADECSATGLLETYPFPSTRPSSASGAIEFGTSQATDMGFDIPCELDIEIDAKFWAQFYWVPGAASFRGQAVPVAGACE